MLSFINEIDDPIVQKDILDLNRASSCTKKVMDEERFKPWLPAVSMDSGNPAFK